MNNNDANSRRELAARLRAEMKRRFRYLQWTVINIYGCAIIFFMSQPQLTKNQKNYIIIFANLVIIAIALPVGLKIVKMREEADKLEAEQDHE